MTSTPQQWIIRALLNLRHRLLNGELQATGELTRSMAWRYDEENSDDEKRAIKTLSSLGVVEYDDVDDGMFSDDLELTQA